MQITDRQIEMENEYFEWMYHIVCNSNNKQYNKVSYRKLLTYLNNFDFVPLTHLDGNRYADGIDFRYCFGYEHEYPNNEIKLYLDTKNCSMLEMMVALAYRVESQIMTNPMYGDRTGQWFWSMIVSLGLGQMTDDKFNPEQCKIILDRFNRKEYEPNGKGGLFTLENPPDDVRNVDIWCQFSWYLNEVAGEEGRL